MSERKHWVFADPCGCPFGVLSEPRSMTEAQAFADFYESGKAFMDAVRKGVTATRYDHATYVCDVSPMLSLSYACPHGGPS